MSDHLLLDLMTLLLGSALLVALCHRLGLSTIIGYLVSGLVFGPHGIGLLQQEDALQVLAEVGVVLLMFTIGLEFSLPRLLAARRLVLGLGGAQVLLVTVLFAAGSLFLGADPAFSVVLGGAFAMSSTAIVLKQLGEQGELRTQHGQVATGILLFQDVAAIPFLVLLPLLGEPTVGFLPILGLTLLKAAGVFLLLATLGRGLLPGVLHWVADTRSLELFMLAVLALALGAAGLSVAVGLSATLGAFMAGMLLGETHFRHQVEADIRPFRDLMLGLFFISVGTQLDPGVLLREPMWIVTIVALLVLLKGGVIMVLVRLFDYPWHEAARAAIALAHGGEFGLLLVSQTLLLGLPGTFPLQPILAGLIVSMLLAPLLVRYNAHIVQRVRGGTVLVEGEPENMPAETRDLMDHVIVCGFGHLGLGVAAVLEESNVPVLGIDRDARRVRECRANGHEVLFGDAGNAVMLELAGVERARALAITFHDPEDARRIIAQALRLHPQLPILVHTRHGWDQAEESLPESVTIFDSTLESSLMYARALMLMAGMDDKLSEKAVNAVRADDYSVLRQFD
ncbi:MAG: potassium transporter [Gammaproteobacteria bacterium]|nr:MAG: potassium transporter [Gammaproteobacteria bacterium]